jgi:hypothetical protein
MRLLSSLRDGWTALRDEQRRERDERERTLRLLATRDAFFALFLVLLPLLSILQMYLLRDAGGLRAVAALPMVVFMLAAVVHGVSWKMRGGGFSRNVAALQVVYSVLGVVLAYGLVYLLDWVGVLPRRDGGSVIALLIGAVGGALLGFLAIRRREPPNE